MLNNPVKRSLKKRKKTFGSWMQIGHPVVAEVMSRTGLDWIVIDLEHASIDFESMINIIRAIQLNNCVPFVRLPENSQHYIQQALDAGAMGLIIPMVNSKEDAEKAVAAAKYPPQGKRGFGFCRANAYGIDFQSYVKIANDEIAVVVQIEHKDAIANIHDILKVDGVDGVFIGPYDLSGSMGIVGQLEHHRIKQSITQILKACKKYGKFAGLHVVKPSVVLVKQAIKQGFTFIALSIDTLFIDDGCRKILGGIK